MAEVVFQSLEGMLPELEDLERQGVFTREELRIIIKRRTDFEYKLQKRIMDKNDVMSYLEYELKLDILRKKRSKRLKLKPYSTSALAVTKRIHTLFRKALMKFGDDVKLWMQYIDFCKKMENVRAMGIALGKMIQQHSSKPDVWLLAAKFEVEETNNIDNARSLLQRALRVHKLSKELWHETFRLELLHVDKIKKRRKILGVGGIELKDESDSTGPKELDSFLANKTANIVFQNAIKIISDDVQFRLDFLNVCEDFEDVDELEDMICESAAIDFSRNASVYETSSKLPIIRLKKQTENIVKDDEWITAENNMVGRFQEAVKKLKTSDMWEKYLNAFGELLHESMSPQQAQRRIAIIKNIFTSAEKSNLTTESMYIFWSDLLIEMGDSSQALQCLTKALKTYKQNIPIWKSYLILKAKSIDCWTTLQNEFKKCLTSLKQKDIQILQMYLDAALQVGDDETSTVFEMIINTPQADIKRHFLPQYLDWLHTTKGIKSARKLYQRILKDTNELEVIEKCLSIEETQDIANLKHIRSLHEKAIDLYGTNNADETRFEDNKKKACRGEEKLDVWISYLNFENTILNNDLQRVGILYNKAKRTLHGQHNSEFLTKYSLLLAAQ